MLDVGEVVVEDLDAAVATLFEEEVAPAEPEPAAAVPAAPPSDQSG